MTSSFGYSMARSKLGCWNWSSWYSSQSSASSHFLTAIQLFAQLYNLWPIPRSPFPLLNTFRPLTSTLKSQSIHFAPSPTPAFIQDVMIVDLDRCCRHPEWLLRNAHLITSSLRRKRFREFSLLLPMGQVVNPSPARTHFPVTWLFARLCACLPPFLTPCFCLAALVSKRPVQWFTSSRGSSRGCLCPSPSGPRRPSSWLL